MTNTIDSESMSKSRTIQVPRELVEKWISQIWHEGTPVRVAADDLYLASQAAQWGYDQREPELQERADQELEACCEWIDKNIEGVQAEYAAAQLRAARRPTKSLSLAEQALRAAYVELQPEARNGSLIISALKRLRELEAQND